MKTWQKNLSPGTKRRSCWGKKVNIHLQQSVPPERLLLPQPLAWNDSLRIQMDSRIACGENVVIWVGWIFEDFENLFFASPHLWTTPTEDKMRLWKYTEGWWDSVKHRPICAGATKICFFTKRYLCLISINQTPNYLWQKNCLFDCCESLFFLRQGTKNQHCSTNRTMKDWHLVGASEMRWRYVAGICESANRTYGPFSSPRHNRR